jgi:Tfp pilus assembly protein PilF
LFADDIPTHSPPNTMPELNEGITLCREGRRSEAERAFIELLRTNPENTGALRAVAEIYTATNRAGDALSLWRRLARVCPTDASILRQLGSALLADHAYVEAIDALRAAIAIEPGSARAYNNLGLAQLRAGDASAAADTLQTAVTLDPAYSLGHLNLGVALMSQGRATDAAAAFERALEIKPDLVEAHLHLSELLHERDPLAARYHQQRAFERRAIDLQAMQRHDEAIAVISRLIDSGSRLPYLEGMRLRCKLDCCDWNGYSESVARMEAATLAGASSDLPCERQSHDALACATSWAHKSILRIGVPAGRGAFAGGQRDGL